MRIAINDFPIGWRRSPNSDTEYLLTNLLELARIEVHPFRRIAGVL